MELLNSAPSKVFLTVTRLYFSAEDQGERSVCLTFAFLFLLLAMLVQVVPEETLELGLEPGTCIRGMGWAPVTPCCKLMSVGFKGLDAPAHCR